MCVVTGRHMVLDDWCFCPASKAPAIYSAYVRYIEAEIQAAYANNSSSPSSSSSSSSSGRFIALDPVLGKPVAMADLKRSTTEEAAKYIQRYNNVLEEKPKQDADGGGEGDTDGRVTSEGASAGPKLSAEGAATSGKKGGKGGAGEESKASQGRKERKSRHA